jgi:hypothetical protein
VSADTLTPHYTLVRQALTRGQLVAFFGAGVNLCGRPTGVGWQLGQYLPNGGELSTYLGKEYGYPDKDSWDLLRVSQYVAVMAGAGPLYNTLRTLFDVDYPLTPLHGFFASLPALLRAKGYPPNPLIVTTNYDDLMERALASANEPFDVVSYIADGEYRGMFIHQPPDGAARMIERPNEYLDLSPDKRTVVLKIHGAVNRRDPEQDSYVITEDHYIDYLTRTDLANLIPIQLVQKLTRSHILFLGYGLRDWNLRAMLHRIWKEQRLKFKSWAIQLRPEAIDQEFWRARNVDIIDVPLDDYIAALGQAVQTMPAKGSNP